uniref:Uncharacterized protein n=1 Tax=Panagrolaimus sp. JU765 TaxID=591449 RepID=A0AC34R3A2_9BILA
MPMRGPQQSGGLFAPGPPGQQQMTNFPGSGPQQQSQQQSFPGQPPQQQATGFPGQPPQQQGTGFPGQQPQQQGNTFPGPPPQQGSTFPGQSGQPSGPFPGQPPQQGFYQQGNQPPPQMFSQQQQQRPQLPQQFQSQPTPPQQQPGPQPASQQTQPGSLLQPPSQGQPQGPGSHQPPSYQGPSPAVQAVTSVGRAPTPSGRSNQSTTTVSQEVFNSPDYQAALKELCSYKETCFRLVDRVKLDGAEHLSANFTKVLQIIEGKIQVPKELLLKLIRNVQSLEGKYNVTNGLTEAMAILQKQPEIDISTFTLIHEKYGRFSSEYITAPKKLYSIIERKKRFKNETLYLKRRMKWIDQN